MQTPHSDGMSCLFAQAQGATPSRTRGCYIQQVARLSGATAQCLQE